MLKPQSHGVYDQVITLPATEKRWNRGQIVERTYDWSQRSWVIARAKSVVARCSKLLTYDSKSFGATIDRTICRMYSND